MIRLPENYLDLAYVDNLKGVIYLHFKNDADEYFTYRYFLDKAFDFEQHMRNLESLDFSNKPAYKLNPDLSTIFTEPRDQNWIPAPVPGDNIISFAQYKVHSRMAKHEDQVNRQRANNLKDSNVVG